MKSVLLKVLFPLMLAFALAGVLTSGALAAENAPVPEDEQPESGSFEVELFHEGSLNGKQTLPTDALILSVFSATEDDMYQRIYQGLYDREETIELPLEDPNITWEQLRELIVSVYSRVVNDHPEMFYVTGGVSWNRTQTQIFLFPYYNPAYGSEETRIFNERVGQILSEAEELPTDLQKALFIHDYLTVNCAYNWDVATMNKETGGYIPPHVYSAYGAIVIGDAVCQGYAEAYQLLLNKLGINCILVSSNALNHAWNLVELDGEWCHVDVTWDDPVPDTNGRCRHTYFLLSDETIKDSTHRHTSWDTETPACTSERFESGYAFNESTTPFYFYNGSIYYLSYEGKNAIDYIYRSTDLSGPGEKLKQLPNYWYGGVVWLNGRLYWAEPTERFKTEGQYRICVYELDTGAYKTIAYFNFTKAASQDDYYTSGYDAVGLLYSEEDEVIKATSSTRRECLAEAPVQGHSIAWDKVETNNIAIAGFDKSTAQLGLVMGTNAPERVTVFAAYYLNGQLVFVDTQSVEKHLGVSALDIRSQGLPEYDAVKYMLLSPKNMPVCASLTA